MLGPMEGWPVFFRSRLAAVFCSDGLGAACALGGVCGESQKYDLEVQLSW